MHAIELNAQIDDRGEIHLKLPDPHARGQARVIVLYEPAPAPELEPQPEARPTPDRRMPSPRLANRGAKLHGDDIAPAFAVEEWGDLYQ